MSSIESFVKNKLLQLHAKSLYRGTNITNKIHEQITYNDQPIISFSCSNYLGLRNIDFDNHHIKEIQCISSPLITGYNNLYQSLEQQLCSIYGYQNACIFGSGYLANIGTIPALLNRHDLIITDRYIHACILDGIVISNAKLLRYEHNNLTDLEDKLCKYRSAYNNCLVITESVFSIHGTMPDIASISQLAKKYNAWFMVDNAHGLAYDQRYCNLVDIHMGSFSKALSGYGGYVLASNSVIDYLKNRARTYIYSTALPDYVIKHNIDNLRYVQDNPSVTKIPINHARLFCQTLQIEFRGSNIVAIFFNSNEEVLSISRKLLQHGMLVIAIRPPTVDKPCIRIIFTAHHTTRQVKQLADLIQEIRKLV